MANVVTAVTIGDYEYTLYDNQTAAAKVTDTTKSSYGALQASVTHQSVTYALTSVESCFRNCTSLTTAPEIPSGVTNMSTCFYGCRLLTTAPSIPSGVTNMWMCFAYTRITIAPVLPNGVSDIFGCFQNCSYLTTAPTIPSSVVTISRCFQSCSSLTGTIEVHGTPRNYESCFNGTTQPIALYVPTSSEAPTWQQIASTGKNGNVTVLDPSTNPAPTATLNVTRVGAAQSTVPDEIGNWAYIQVETTISTDQAPDNVAQAPIITLDGRTTSPYQAQGTASYVGWVRLYDDKTHRFGATPRDTYKTGAEIIVPLAGTYSPMEFYTKPILNEHDEVIGYDGGVGASFGKHATQENLLDCAWPISSDVDVSSDNYSLEGLGDYVDGGLIDVYTATSQTHTVAALSTTSYTFSPQTVQGYLPIGVVGFSNDDMEFAVTVGAHINLTTRQITVYTKNFSNRAIDIVDYVEVLYIRRPYGTT